jgi:hypothetical protein
VLTALAWPQLQGRCGRAAAAVPARPARPAALAVFTLAYGLAGLGYIVTATFLPVIARQALPGGRSGWTCSGRCSAWPWPSAR